MKNAYTVLEIRLGPAGRENDFCACDHCGAITNYNDMFNVTVESEDTRSGTDDLILCATCCDTLEEVNDQALKVCDGCGREFKDLETVPSQTATDHEDGTWHLCQECKGE